MNLFLDYETWSSVPIRRGTDVYLDNAKPMLLTYAFDDGPVFHWDITSDPNIPAGFYRCLVEDVTFIAHNAFFDRMVALKCCGWDVPVNRWRCTYAQAMAHGLPGGLGPLCQVLGVSEDQSKIADGMRLIRKFCGPKPLVKDHDWDKFIEYAIRDTEAMRQCYKRMPNWNYQGDELAMWHLDQIINMRGFGIDRQFADAAIKALNSNKDALADATHQATGGAVTAATQRDKLLMYLCEVQGCFLPDLKAATIDAALEDESLEPATKELLRIRRESSKSSTSKYKRLAESAGKDGRLRGTLQFAGASRTARWAGRIFQPQNLPRPTMNAADTRNCIEAIRNGHAEVVTLFAPMSEVCSNAIRGLIVAEPGKKLIIADYSAIEGRVNAWISGETWKVKAFRDGADLYKVIYSKAFGIPVEQVNKGQRQIGKVQELALGYGGGVGAFLNMSAAYGMDLDALGVEVPKATPEDVMAKGLEAWERALSDDMTFGLTEAAYVACDSLKTMYRRANTEIVKSWYMYEDAARKVIQFGDKQKIQVGPLSFDSNGKWMRIQLPSGRFLCYALPKIHNDGTISYMSWRNKKWSRTKTYGGKLCENIVQAVSRDLLAYAMRKAEAAGYPIVLHIHDEIIVESAEKTLAGLIAIMTANPPWARGLPLGAEGFEGTRYEKH